MTPFKYTPPLDHIQDIFTRNQRACYSRFDDTDIDLVMNRDTEQDPATSALAKEIIESMQINDPRYIRSLSINRLHDTKGNREMMDRLLFRMGSLDNVIVEKPGFQHFIGSLQPWVMHEIFGAMVYPRHKMYVGSMPLDQLERLVGPVDYYINTPQAAYSTIGQWWPEVARHLPDVEMVLSSAGSASRVINKRIWNTGLELQAFDMALFNHAMDESQSRKWIDTKETHPDTDTTDEGYIAHKELIDQPEYLN